MDDLTVGDVFGEKLRYLNGRKVRKDLKIKNLKSKHYYVGFANKVLPF